MATNFLQIEPGGDRSNTWRNVLVAIVLFVGIGVGWVWYMGASSIPLSSLEDTAPAVVAGQTTSGAAHLAASIDGQAGGDVVVPPPEDDVGLHLPILEGDLLPGDTLSAKGVIVKDVKTGVVLYAKNEYEARPIASITKLMSALVLLEKGPEWDRVVEVSPDDVIDTHMYAGEAYTVEALWRAALVGSSNKAILTLVDAAGWPRAAFVERMNQKALELGMGDTHFVEPTGLDARNVSTPADLVLLLNETMSVNEIRQTVLLREYQLVSDDRAVRHHMWNTNWLLLGWINNQLFDLRGGKTGYINASGYNFAMQVGDANDNIVSVIVLGTKSHEARFEESRDVAVSVFENYAWPERRVAGEKVEQ
jgi:D-alanyl-D-alanine endopeptidase (penicillin-binding protein 7)